MHRNTAIGMKHFVSTGGNTLMLVDSPARSKFTEDKLKLMIISIKISINNQIRSQLHLQIKRKGKLIHLDQNIINFGKILHLMDQILIIIIM